MIDGELLVDCEKGKACLNWSLKTRVMFRKHKLSLSKTACMEAYFTLQCMACCGSGDNFSFLEEIEVARVDLLYVSCCPLSVSCPDTITACRLQ